MTKIRSEFVHPRRNNRWGEFNMRNLLAVCVTVIAIAVLAPARADLPVRDTRFHDVLDDLNFAAGEGGTGFENGESVHMFNGNLQVVHASSPSYPVDGGMSFGVSRVYNSNSVVSDTVFNNGNAVRGVSWVGLGWKMHLGRFYSVKLYDANTSPRYKKKRY